MRTCSRERGADSAFFLPWITAFRRHRAPVAPHTRVVQRPYRVRVLFERKLGHLGCALRGTPGSEARIPRRPRPLMEQ